MSTYRIVARATVLASVLAVSLWACDDTSTPTEPMRPAAGDPSLHRARGSDDATDRGSASLDRHVRRDLAALRRLTAPFHSLDRATHAGWTLEVTPCMDMPPLGGMGFHYGNPKYIDGTVNVLEPELLMYEPGPHGQMRLVGVEYIVPLAAWQGSKPPTLFGREFKVNEQFGVWALHAWVWKHNPAGMFADWNPNVSCMRGR